MPRTVTQKPKSTNNDDYLTALGKWEACKPPYSNTHIRTCVTAGKMIMSADGQARRSKYEKEHFLRIDFSKAGKVTFYAEFPKKMGLKGRKLGEWPEMSLEIAREKSAEISSDGLKADSVQMAVDAYRAELKGKVARKKLSQGSYDTYECRIKHIESAFGTREVFADVTYNRLIEVINGWIDTKTNNQALELFAELRRLWKFATPTLCNGRNVAASIADDYVSSRVQKPTPTRRFTDIESIASLWINIASAPSQQQKNAVRYMILTGVRPINISNLRWEYVTDDFSEIVYPAGVIGMRGAMKTQKEFRIPVTPAMRRILEEQKSWRDGNDRCNKEFVFLQPRDPEQPFSKRSLDKLVKDYSPENSVKGVVHDGTVKGRSGAFNTMCRKFLKSNIIALMKDKGYSRSDRREISQLAMHHSDRKDDPMGEFYDFSDEILHEEMSLKRLAFETHEASILAQAALIRKR